MGIRFRLLILRNLAGRPFTINLFSAELLFSSVFDSMNRSLRPDQLPFSVDEMFEQREAGEPAEIVWLKAQHPELKEVEFEVVDDGVFEGGACEVSPDGTSVLVLIGAGSAERFASLKESRADAIRSMADRLGVPFEEMDGDMIRQFILFHEVGHARDFLTNFVSRETGLDPRSAECVWRENAQIQMDSLPFPGVAPADLREDILLAGGFAAWRELEPFADAWCREKNVSSEQELIALQEPAYRALQKEAYADEFAAKAYMEMQKGKASKNAA